MAQSIITYYRNKWMTYPLGKNTIMLANDRREFWPSIGEHFAIQFPTNHVVNDSYNLDVVREHFVHCKYF